MAERFQVAVSRTLFLRSIKQIQREPLKRDDESTYEPLPVFRGNRNVPCTQVSVPEAVSLRSGLNVSTCQGDTQPRQRKFNKLLEFRDSNKVGDRTLIALAFIAAGAASSDPLRSFLNSLLIP